MWNYRKEYYTLFPNASETEYDYILLYLFISEYCGVNSSEFKNVYRVKTNIKVADFEAYLISKGINPLLILRDAFILGCKLKDEKIEKLRNAFIDETIHELCNSVNNRLN